MGRHHDKKYGLASGYSSGYGRRSSRYGSAYGSSYGRYGMRTGGGLMALIPLIGLGAVAAVIFSFFKKRTLFGRKGFGWKSWGVKNTLATGAIATTGIAATNCASTCATVGLNEKLVAAERLPGVKYREVDVITRKRIPLHEVREIYEGPAQMEVFEGTQREYVAPDVGCATGVAATGGFASGYAGQVCTTNCTPVGGIAAGGIATGGISTGYGLSGRLRNRWFKGPQVGAGTTITN